MFIYNHCQNVNWSSAAYWESHEPTEKRTKVERKDNSVHPYPAIPASSDDDDSYQRDLSLFQSDRSSPYFLLIYWKSVEFVCGVQVWDVKINVYLQRRGTGTESARDIVTPSREQSFEVTCVLLELVFAPAHRQPSTAGNHGTWRQVR